MIQPLPRLTDTHCHLNSQQFEGDLPQVLERAQEAGIVRVLIPGLDIGSSEKAVKLAEAHEQLYAAVGIHPHYASDWTKHDVPKLRELASSAKVVAIGEIGLDYYRDYVLPEVQLHAYREQLILAIDLGLPVVLHNRQSLHHILEEIQIRAAEFPEARAGVLHSFAGTTEQAKKAEDLGLFIGIGGPVTYKNAESLTKTVTSITRDRLLLETDAPYLPPQSYRGERNEPAYVRFVAEKLSSVLDMTTQDLTTHTYQNSVQLFGWSNGS
jgi:TatD DNase family protein